MPLMLRRGPSGGQTPRLGVERHPAFTLELGAKIRGMNPPLVILGRGRSPVR
jgi:hypothetical protein